MNQTIETILNHRSIRSFTDERLTKDEVLTLVKSAQAASTSSYVQAYSIIGVTDQEKKAKLAKLAGNQPYVEKNGHFFVFCADLKRHDYLAQKAGKNHQEAFENTEAFLISVIDAALAAQNLSVAAESMGLGICYIGGLRNQLKEVSELLETPAYVLPLFGLAVGHPANPSSQKERLPAELIYHENSYQQDEAHMDRYLKEYDERISAYYEERTNGERKDTWSEQMLRGFSQPKRTYLGDFVKEKGFNRK
ncbi:NADPH-dependent oxidoreductase [Bacillus xiamenensis]|uniref:NADPH-dependent oxidoreductase n=1 Tax=Bacillus xiamenensis TaxID=1178537 RepID=A0AAC9IGB2_9BACI|nr:MULTISPECIES: oxygen-insensitive NADPH nitroreductase [Bacillus]AOZ88917.1 NADPH-dependent oxidoreductase [Bacillus xiamenensis]MBG9910217.1 NADPH-dependent oxidoreductase [Bacillus xiamenensis]MCY9575152.1 oxygen-insensitive NADPH nitroreductase [Bacillus xiamenensis]QGX64354.1 oxygen-insensitive NADPH nitroreductase [Bacillus sp. ms-22]